MPRTIYLSVRGDGAWRVLEAFRRELGEEAATLVVHPSRDESGFYGSADVSDPAAAREAFSRARQTYPTLKAHFSAPPPESEDSSRRQGASIAQTAQRPAEGRERAERRDGQGRRPGSGQAVGDERHEQRGQQGHQGDQRQDRGTTRRRRRQAR